MLDYGLGFQLQSLKRIQGRQRLVSSPRVEVHACTLGKTLMFAYESILGDIRLWVGPNPEQGGVG